MGNQKRPLELARRQATRRWFGLACDAAAPKYSRERALKSIAFEIPAMHEPASAPCVAEELLRPLVWCCLLDGTFKTDGFLLRARRKPKRYPQVSRGFATTHWAKRRGFKCQIECSTALVLLHQRSPCATARYQGWRQRLIQHQTATADRKATARHVVWCFGVGRVFPTLYPCRKRVQASCGTRREMRSWRSAPTHSPSFD